MNRLEKLKKISKYIPAISPKARSLRESEYFYSRGKKYLRSEGEILTKSFPSGVRNTWYPLPGATPVPVVPHAQKQDFFTFRGKRYPKSEGVVERYTAPNGRTYIVWTPKTVKGAKRGRNPMSLKQQKERKIIMDEMKLMDPKLIKEMSSTDLKIYMNKKFNIDRGKEAIGDMRRVAIGKIGSGSKPDIPGMWSNQDHLNALSESGKETVSKFMKDMYQLNKGKGRDINYGGTLVSALNRMMYQAKKQNIKKSVWDKLSDDALEAKVMKKITDTDTKRLSEIMDEKGLLQRKVNQARDMGIELDDLDLSHMEDVAANWERALDLNNFFIAESRANRYTQLVLNNRIKKIKTSIKKAETFAEKRAIASEMKEIRQQLIDNGLVSKIEGRTYGQARTPGEIERRLDNLINTQLAHTALNRGGIVNGYSGGGKVKKLTQLLDDAIGMMSRRKFLKGTGATALSTVLPKSALKLAPAVIKQGAYNFAPPWVNGMLSALKSVTKEQAGTKIIPSIMGNKAEIIKLDAKAYKLYKNQTGKETHFRVKTADYKMHDDVTIAKGEAPPYSYDDIILREEPGQTSITWKNKEYDHGNDQHIVIDKINKETRFVDDNWHMEAGGEDIAKDDWIEWAITPNKNEIKVALKKPLDQIDDMTVDGYSVRDMDNEYSGMFESYVDSFSPSGNVFGTVNRMVKKIKKKDQLRQQKKWNDEQVRNLEEKNMMDWEGQFRGGKGIHAYDRGGIARRPNAVPPTSGPDPYATFINDSVAQIRSSPSEFMGSQFIQKFNKGGFVKRNAPKVLGKITNYRPKLTMSDVLKNIQKAKKKNTIGLTQTEKKAAILGDVKPEESGALFWGSREKIIGAPSEAMTGTQWLQYMKLPKHGILNPKGYPVIKDMELNDTSLAPWLSRMGNKTVSKPDLVRQFDEMAPTMDVVALGDTTGGRIISDLASSLKKIDTQAIRNPAIKGFYDYLKAVMPQLKDSTTSTESKAIIKYIDEMVYNNFGVKDALTEGVPQRFPFEIKEVLQSLSTALGKRTAGFKTYRRQTQHEGTQMMEGGENYREFLFRHTPGSLRQNEPGYKYAHDFNLSSVDRAGGVVHARTSDRGDQFGRRLLHIEEIQSDMHQKVNAAQRKVKKQIAEWEKQGLKPHEAYLKLSTRQRKEFDELTASSKYAPRGDMKEEIGTANEQHLALIVSKVEDLLAQPQTKQIVARLTKLKRERTKVRKMIKEEQAKMAAGDHSGVPQGPLSKTEDYNEFIMKYLLRVAREGGYDGLTINTAAIKNKGLNVTNKDYRGNLVAYGPMAKGAMEKAAKKSGAKFMKTYIMDGDKKVWEVPMILFKENKAAQAIIDKGLPVYKRGGTVKK